MTDRKFYLLHIHNGFICTPQFFATEKEARDVLEIQYSDVLADIKNSDIDTTSLKNAIFNYNPDKPTPPISIYDTNKYDAYITTSFGSFLWRIGQFVGFSDKENFCLFSSDSVNLHQTVFSSREAAKSRMCKEFSILIRDRNIACQTGTTIGLDYAYIKNQQSPNYGWRIAYLGDKPLCKTAF